MFIRRTVFRPYSLAALSERTIALGVERRRMPTRARRHHSAAMDIATAAASPPRVSRHDSHRLQPQRNLRLHKGSQRAILIWQYSQSQYLL
jgi:hypothetical protein